VILPDTSSDDAGTSPEKQQPSETMEAIRKAIFIDDDFATVHQHHITRPILLEDEEQEAEEEGEGEQLAAESLVEGDNEQDDSAVGISNAHDSEDDNNDDESMLLLPLLVNTASEAIHDDSLSNIPPLLPPGRDLIPLAEEDEEEGGADVSKDVASGEDGDGQEDVADANTEASTSEPETESEPEPEPKQPPDDATSDQQPPAAATEDSPKNRVVVDYASKAASALVLEKSSNFDGTSNLLTGDNDKYALAPCNDEGKYVVIGLSEDILVKQLVLANYERYSSHPKQFQVLGSQTYPDATWFDLGTYTAQPGNDAQTFDLVDPTWARYLKLRFITHYGAEHYFTVSQIKVHGSTMLQGFHEQWKESEEEVKMVIEAVEGEGEDETDGEVEASEEGDDEDEADEEKNDTEAEGEEATISGNDATESSDDASVVDDYVDDEDGAEASPPVGANGDNEENVPTATEPNESEKAKVDLAIEEPPLPVPDEPGGQDDSTIDVLDASDLVLPALLTNDEDSHRTGPPTDNLETDGSKRPDHAGTIEATDANEDHAPTDNSASNSALTSSDEPATATAVPSTGKSSVKTATDESSTYDFTPIRHEEGDDDVCIPFRHDIDIAPAMCADMNISEMSPDSFIAAMNGLHQNHSALSLATIARESADSTATDGTVASMIGNLSSLASVSDAFIRSSIDKASDVIRGVKDSSSIISTKNKMEDTRRAGAHRALLDLIDESSFQAPKKPAKKIEKEPGKKKPPSKKNEEPPQVGVMDAEVFAALASKYPAASCLKHLNFQEFKTKIIEARAKKKPAVVEKANGHPQPGKIEPIFKTLTDEIKSLQVSQSIYDQYIKAVTSCYQRIMIDVTNELKTSESIQVQRLSLLEDAIRDLQAQSRGHSALESLILPCIALIWFAGSSVLGALASLFQPQNWFVAAELISDPSQLLAAHGQERMVHVVAVGVSLALFLLISLARHKSQRRKIRRSMTGGARHRRSRSAPDPILLELSES